MGAEQKAKELGISFPIKEKGYLNLCVRSGNMLITSGHVSDVKGKLGAGLSVELGCQAAQGRFASRNSTCRKPLAWTAPARLILHC